MKDILPDSRAKTTRGRIFRGSQSWVPVFCANCGKDGGMCPEENMTFLFYQCEPCARTYGEVAGTMVMPDEVFFAKVRAEQEESFGRYLGESELQRIVQEGASPLATLIKSGH